MDPKIKDNPDLLQRLIAQNTQHADQQRKHIQHLQQTLKLRTQQLDRLQLKLKSMHIQKSQKQQIIRKIQYQIQILNGQITVQSKLKYEYDQAINFVSQTPQQGVRLLISQLKQIDSILTDTQVAQISKQKISYQVYYKDDFCIIRSSNPDYTFQELCRDAAVYFSLFPQDCILKDELDSVYPAKAAVSIHYDNSSHIYLGLKHGRLARNLQASQIDWQQLAAQNKLEVRLRAMRELVVARGKSGQKRGQKQKNLTIMVLQFFLYLLFLTQLFYFVFSQQVVYSINLRDAYQLNTGLKEVFVYEDFPADCDYPDGLSIQFLEIKKPDQFFCWFQNVLISGIFAQPQVDNRIYILEYNQLGGVRIRQLRVNGKSCKKLNYKTNEIYDSSQSQCFDDYTETDRSEADFGPALEETCRQQCQYLKAFQFSDKIKNSYYSYGRISEYDDTGFYIDSIDIMDDGVLKQQTMLDLLQYLKQNLWIDRQTRAIIINFTIYNINYNYFTTIQLILEVGGSSLIIPHFKINSMFLSYYSDSWKHMTSSAYNFFIKVPEIYCYFYNIIGILIPLIIGIYRHKSGYFGQMWSYIEVILFILVLGVTVLRVVLFIQSQRILDFIQTENFDNVIDMSTLSEILSYLWGFESFAVLFGCMKLLNYFKIQSMTMIWDTLSRGAKSIFAFYIVYIVLVSSFAMMAKIVYGYQLENFSSFYRSLASLFIIILGDIELYSDMSKLQPYFTPVFFLAYMFLMFFVIMNIFVAILNQAFGVVVETQRTVEEKAKITQIKNRLLGEFKFYGRTFKYWCSKCCKRSNIKRTKAFKHFKQIEEEQIIRKEGLERGLYLGIKKVL